MLLRSKLLMSTLRLATLMLRRPQSQLPGWHDRLRPRCRMRFRRQSHPLHNTQMEAESLGRIIRIRPGTVNDRWIVIRDIHLGGRRRLDDDVLGRRLSFLCLATTSLRRGRALDRDGLLLRRLRLPVGLRASTQSLDRVLSSGCAPAGIAEFCVQSSRPCSGPPSGPGRAPLRCRPSLLGERSRQCFTLEAVVRLRPAVGLHQHLEWIRRCDQDL